MQGTIPLDVHVPLRDRALRVKVVYDFAADAIGSVTIQAVR